LAVEFVTTRCSWTRFPRCNARYDVSPFVPSRRAFGPAPRFHLEHDNFKDPDSAPLVTSFDLPLHRGVILLKDGHVLGNGS
jgi:hypothetical protein